MIRYRRDLWQLVKDMPGDLAELGIAEGLFSRDMLDWPLADAPRLFLVDRWCCVPNAKGDSANSQEWHDKNLADVQARVARFGDRAVILRGDSVEMARQVPDKSLRLVYLDADHSFDGVMRDLVAWLPKLGAGAVCAGHDFATFSYGVRNAVTSFCEANSFTANLIPEDADEDAGFYFFIP